MNAVAVFVYPVVERLVGDAVGQREILQMQVAGDVFGLAVEAGRQRNMVQVGVECRRFSERKGNHDMDDVGIGNGGLQNGGVGFRDHDRVFMQIVV